MALASLVILSIFRKSVQSQENISVRKLNIREKMYIPRYSEFLFLYEKFDIFFVIKKFSTAKCSLNTVPYYSCQSLFQFQVRQKFV